MSGNFGGVAIIFIALAAIPFWVYCFGSAIAAPARWWPGGVRTKAVSLVLMLALYPVSGLVYFVAVRPRIRRAQTSDSQALNHLAADTESRPGRPWGWRWWLWIAGIVGSVLVASFAILVIGFFDDDAWNYPATGGARTRGLVDVGVALVLILAPWIVMMVRGRGHRLPLGLGAVPAAALLVAFGLTIIRGPAGNPDPGNQLLHRLEAQLKAAGTPPGATAVKTTSRPVEYTGSAFEGGGWSGGGVSLAFTVSGPIRNVYAYYARRAKALGFHVESNGHLRVPDVWTKSSAGHGLIYLRLADLGSSGDPEVSYFLTLD